LGGGGEKGWETVNVSGRSKLLIMKKGGGKTQKRGGREGRRGRLKGLNGQRVRALVKGSEGKTKVVKVGRRKKTKRKKRTNKERRGNQVNAEETGK